MHLSRRDLLAGAGGVGLCWPLGACAAQQVHHRLHPHGINLPLPNQNSGYFIDGCQTATIWDGGVGKLDANLGLVGDTADRMQRQVGLLGTAGATSYDVVTANIDSIFIPGGVVGAPGGSVTLRPKPGTTQVSIKDHNSVQMKVTPTGKGPVTLHVIPTQWRKLWDSGERISPDLLKRLSGFSSIRPMDALRTNGSKITTERPLPTAQTYFAGLPVEVLADIANAAKTDLVLNVPHLISDGLLLEWIQAAHKRLDPALKLLVEPSNEVWNGSFPQGKWAVTQAQTLLGGAAAGAPGAEAGQPPRVPDGAAKIYGRMGGRIALAIRQIVGDRPSRVKVMLAWKFLAPKAWAPILEGYKSTGAPVALIDSIAVAFYPQFGGPDRDNWIRWAQAGDFASANAALDAWAVKRIPLFAQHADFATSIGAAFDLYECSVGQLTSQAPVVKDDVIRPTVTDFNIALTHSAAGVARYARLLDAFVAAGGRTPHYYDLIGKGSQYGVYGLYANMQDETGYPAATFVRERNAAARREQPGTS